MAAQVEVQTGEVGRTGVGGRLHLSPLADSSNKSLMEGTSKTQGSLIITSEPSKPVPAPKPRLTPKPFTVEKNPTIRPILAPKPNTKPRPVPTCPTFYKPDPPSAVQPQQPNVTSKHRPVPTNPSRPAPTSYKPSPKLSMGQTTKPVAQPFKPAPLLTLGDPSKPTPSQLVRRQKPAAAGLSHSRGLKKAPSAEWSGSTKQEKERNKTASSIRAGGASMTRAKSMGFLSQIGQDEEERKGDEGPKVTVQLRSQSRGSRPRPVSAIFLPSPTQAESPTPAARWAVRRPLSADLTSKFESIGLSLHHGRPAKTDSKENTPEEPIRRTEKEKGAEGTTVTPPAPDSKPSALARGSEKKTEEEKEGVKGGGSIKRRISLLLDSSSSSSPVVPLCVAAQRPGPHSPVQPILEADVPLGGVKQRIRKLTEDTVTPPAQTPAARPTFKSRPLPPDLTKRFGSERSTDLGSPSPNEVTDRHESDTDPHRRVEDSVFSFSDQKKVDEDIRGIQEQPTQTSDPSAVLNEAGRWMESCPSSGVQMVRAALFENVVERHSVLVMEEDRSQSATKGCPKRSVSLKLGDGENDGSLVTATYREPVSPSSPLLVEHSFDTVQAVGERRAVSESVPSAQLEDKAMTLRSRRSEGNRPARAEPVEERQAQVQGFLSLAQRGAPASQQEQVSRYLTVGALQKWNTAEMVREVEKGRQREKERQMEREGKEKEKERQREAERRTQMDVDREKPREQEREREEVAAPKRLKMLEVDEQPPKPRATYFALTGQIQEAVSYGDEEVPFDDLSVKSGQWGSQGKVLQVRRNPSLDEAFGKSSQGQEQELIERNQTQERERGTAWARQTWMEEIEKQKVVDLEKIREFEREKQTQLEMERQKTLEYAKKREKEKQRELERERQIELERQRQRWQELERESQRELERESQRELERESQRELEREQQRELERESQRELERERQRELERESQRELERERQRELERERQRELERQKEFEKERQRQLDLERQKKLERERTAELERIKEIERRQLFEFEKQKQNERERKQLLELEKQRLREKMEREEQEKMRQQAIQQEVDRERELERERRKELEKERQRELERIKEMERRQLFEFEKQKQNERERKQLLELEKQRLREKMEREEQEKMRQQAIQQEVDRERELERERLRELERERLCDLERQNQRELERQRQKQLDFEKQELENQRERKRESERERQSVEELERIKEMEGRQLLEKLEKPKQRLREKMEKEEQEKMRQVARQQEAERQRIMERQRRENQERVALDSLPLRPKVLDLDSVSLGDQHSRGSPHSPGVRWKQPSPWADDHYRPGILDIDSFRSQTETQPLPTREVFPVAGIQGSDQGSGVPSHPHSPEREGGHRMAPKSTVRRPSTVRAPSQPELWEQRLGIDEESVDRPMAGPEPPRKPANKPSLEQLLHRLEDRAMAPILVPERRWSGMPSEPSFPRREPHNPGYPMEQTWFPHDSEPQGHRVESRGQRRSQGSQELNRMRSRSVSRRSAPSESATEGSLSRMRSRSAHRERDRQSWEQLKQRVDGEEERDMDTLVHETDSQYGTWETGLHTDDSLTPATPTSDSNLSQSNRKPTPLYTPGEHAHTPPSDLDTPDGFSPSAQPEIQPLPFPETSTILLDSSALRSRVQLSKMRGARSRPSRVARQTAALSVHPEGQATPTEDWRSRDSTEDKVESFKKEDSDSEEQARGADRRSAAASSQPQRVSLFPGMDPSALMAQLKKRSDSDNQTDGPATSPSQLSRSPKSPFLPRASRMLPPSGGKENGEEASPQWLRELKSKKRLSQYENDS